MGLADAVQVRQLQDIVHQLDHPAGFYMDLPAKFGHIGRFGNAGLNELRIAGNTGQWRFSSWLTLAVKSCRIFSLFSRNSRSEWMLSAKGMSSR